MTGAEQGIAVMWGAPWLQVGGTDGDRRPAWRHALEAQPGCGHGWEAAAGHWYSTCPSVHVLPQVSWLPSDGTHMPWSHLRHQTGFGNGSTDKVSASCTRDIEGQGTPSSGTEIDEGGSSMARDMLCYALA